LFWTKPPKIAGHPKSKAADYAWMTTSLLFCPAVPVFFHGSVIINLLFQDVGKPMRDYPSSKDDP
jgi:hypothetical protein